MIFRSSVLGTLVFAISSLASTFTPIQPPSYPLAVRTPFLNAWLPVTSEGAGLLPASIVEFWDGRHLDWGTMIMVDNVTYSIFGNTNDNHAVQSNALLTPTHTIFYLQAGPVNVTADFFSPVSPKNYTRQSLPFSYYTLSFGSVDGKAHSVQVYNEFGANWAGQNTSLVWSYSENEANGFPYFSISTEANITFSANNMALWGESIFSTPARSNISTQMGTTATLRSRFGSHGFLSYDRSASAQDGGLTAFAHDLGSIKSDNLTFVVGNVRNKAINYLGNARTPYYRAQIPDVVDALTAFYNDYNDAFVESQQVDIKLTTEATAISSNYSDILTLSLRQMFGTMELTIDDTTKNTSQIYVFFKEISTDGNINSVDVTLPMSPGLLHYAPEYIKYLLLPQLDYQLIPGSWPYPWPVHNIGESHSSSDCYTILTRAALGNMYPNATGHFRGIAEQQPIESCGDIILLAHYYNKATGDTAWMKPYETLFRGWADWLALHSLHPGFQLLTTDRAGPVANSTELAIKGAIALASYGHITQQEHYSLIGKQNAAIIANGTGIDTERTHFLLYYNETTNQDPWALGYNLLSDKLLGLNVFPQWIFDMQSAWYPQIRQIIGVPIQYDINWGKTDWNTWCAAFSTPEVRDMFIADIHSYITNGMNTVPLSDRFWVNTNKYEAVGTAALGVKNRPTVGGHWALLVAKNAGLNETLVQAPVSAAPSLKERRALLPIMLSLALMFLE
ncbi:hypothetical protein MMC19_004677 [Ptychographa xylographoides]|nr:hypothetical protein [Ptychographa xylographoides]